MRRKILIALISVLSFSIILVLVLNLTDSNRNISCTANVYDINSINESARITVYAKGNNVNIKTNNGKIINGSYYETEVSENGIYKFYAISGKKEKECQIEVKNIDKSGASGDTIVDTTPKKINMLTNTSLLLNVPGGKVEKWISNNPTVASVDELGNVTAKIAGLVTVTAFLSDNKMCEFIITVFKARVTKISLNYNEKTMIVGTKLNLSITQIIPSYATCDSTTWSSNNNNVAAVTNGNVIAFNTGSAVITATCDGLFAQAKIKVINAEKAIVPSNASIKYEGETLKYYVSEKNDYYLTYIWMEEPYEQIKKLDSAAAIYGKILTDNQLQGKKVYKLTVGEMLNNYVKKNLISKNKALIAYNSSGFYMNPSTTKASDNRSASWFVMDDGIITRSNFDDGLAGFYLMGIDYNGNMKLYGAILNPSERRKVYNKILNDKVKNTFAFTPNLISNSNIDSSVPSDTTKAHRQGFCQINGNNYVMLTTINRMTLYETAQTLKNLGCKTAFNLDGGGSTSMFYKKSGASTAIKVKCSESSGICRSVAEGIYFIEK